MIGRLQTEEVAHPARGRLGDALPLVGIVRCEADPRQNVPDRQGGTFVPRLVDNLLGTQQGPLCELDDGPAISFSCECQFGTIGRPDENVCLECFMVAHPYPPRANVGFAEPTSLFSCSPANRQPASDRARIRCEVQTKRRSRAPTSAAPSWPCSSPHRRDQKFTAIGERLKSSDAQLLTVVRVEF